MIIVLILILLFILLERKYGSFLEKFIDTDYDYYYNGDVLIDTRNKNVSIGVGKNIDPRYTLNVGGTLFVRDKLCYGNTCLDAKMLKMLNDLPHFKAEELCLRTEDNQKVCINEEHIQLLTGQRALKLKSTLDDSRTNTENPKYFGRHNYYAHPNHDDNNDWIPPLCGPGGMTYAHNTCSHSSGNRGNFRGYVANPIMDDFNTSNQDKSCFHLNRGIKWQEDLPEANKFAIQANPDETGRSENFPEIPDRNFKPKKFNYNCYPNT
jgi:hypothetical protein